MRGNMLTKKERGRLERFYLQYRPLMFKVVNRHIQKYGGDVEDAVSEAHEHFIFIYLTHDPKRTTFKKDLAWRLSRRLLETTEKESVRKRHLNGVEATEDNISVDPEPYFDLGGFLSGLRKDAREVVRLLLNSPPDVDLSIVERGGPSPVHVRQALREYLQDMKWSVARIRESFAEISSALTRP